MSDRGTLVVPRFTLIAAAVALIIAYGSLYPFHFHAHPNSDGALLTLLASWRGPFGRGDFVANVLFYLPLGFFLAPAQRSAMRGIAVGIFAGLALSIFMELLQFYDEGRVSALSDVLANTIGAAAGAVAGSILFRDPVRWRLRIMNRQPFAVLLVSCWLGYRLFPFLPVIDLHKYWSAIKPLIFSPSLPFLDFYRHAATWLVVALLLEALLGAARSRVAVPVLLVGVLCARVLILDATLSAAEVVGGGTAALLWSALVSRLQARVPLITGLFAVSIAVEALRPFQFSAAPRPFGWIPFIGFLHGSIEVNIRSFLEKAFTYGSLVWLMVRSGSTASIAVVSSTAFVLGLRLAQMFLPGRSAEITDPIMVLIAGVVMKLIGEDSPRSAEATSEKNLWSAARRNLYESLTCSDSVQPADLIFVMAGRMERKRYGLALYRQGIAPRLVLSVGRYEVSKMPGLEWQDLEALKSVRDQTAAADRHFFVIMDASGAHFTSARPLRRSTYGEVLAFRSFLETQSARKVIVVSTDVHLRRVALTFDTLFRGTPVQFLFCPLPGSFSTMVGDNWWRRPADRWFVIHEMTKLAGYKAALSAPPWVAHRLMLLTGLGRK